MPPSKWAPASGCGSYIGALLRSESDQVVSPSLFVADELQLKAADVCSTTAAVLAEGLPPQDTCHHGCVDTLKAEEKQVHQVDKLTDF